LRFAIISRRSSATNDRLAAASCRGARWEVLTPAGALRELRDGDVALGRLDVLPTLDGVDDGLWVLGELEARGVTVLNGAPALLAAHDKLLTARLLRRAGSHIHVPACFAPAGASPSGLRSC
jgi:glutathione synthase/RimK-type ligase-like ATP-grasp enzyme